MLEAAATVIMLSMIAALTYLTACVDHVIFGYALMLFILLVLLIAGYAVIHTVRREDAP